MIGLLGDIVIAVMFICIFAVPITTGLVLAYKHFERTDKRARDTNKQLLHQEQTKLDIIKLEAESRNLDRKIRMAELRLPVGDDEV